MLYLTATDLSQLTGYRESQFAHMRRWLAERGWPFETDRSGLPRVLRTYHDLRLSGQAQPAELKSGSNADQFTPNAAGLTALHDARKKA